MAISTGLAIGLGLMGAGTQLAGAKMASNASKKAANIQAGAADRALATNQQMFDRATGVQQPYLQMGNVAATTLGRLAMPGQRYTPDLQRQDAARLSAGFGGGMDAAMGTRSGSMAGGGFMPGPDGRPPEGPQMRGARTLGGLAARANTRPNPDVAPMGGDDMVMMEAPDGSQRPVPSSRVGMYEARGARVIG